MKQYYGVPMVGFPFSAEQMYNGKRMEQHGFGISLNIKTITPATLLTTLDEVLNNPSYREKTEKASKIMQDQAMLPTDLGAAWVEHVLKFGGDHLRPHSQDMPAYQLLMLDIFAFLLLSVIVIVASLVYMVRYVFQQCKKPNKSKSE